MKKLITILALIAVLVAPVAAQWPWIYPISPIIANLEIWGDLYITGDLTVGGTTTTSSSVTITGDITATGTVQGANLKATGLTASKPLFTDASKILTSSGTVPVDQGGSGQTSYTDGQLLIGGSTSSDIQKANLTSGSGITIANANNSITISSAAESNVIGVEWNQGTDTWKHIDENGNELTLLTANFDAHPVWGGMVRVNMAVDGTINAVKNGMGTFTNDGTNGRVMVRTPRFWVKSASPSANVYRFWISSTPRSGFITNPAVFQSDGGTGDERDFFYIGAYEADAYHDGTNLVLHSRTGKQPMTGACIIEADFDAGTNEPAIGDDVSTPSDANWFIVDYDLTGGAWDGSGAGKVWIRKPGDDACGWLDNDVITNNTQANQFATCEFTGGAKTALGFNMAEIRGYSQNIGTGWNNWNVWEMSALRLLYYIEYKGANSQTAIGSGITGLAAGTGFAGKLTGADNIDTEVAANGTGQGDGVEDETPIAYRGIENLWGNIWKYIEGYNAVNGVDAANDVKYRVAKKDGTTTFADTLGTYNESPNYTHTGLPDGYQKNIEWSDGFELLFLPKDAGGAGSGNTAYLYDYYYEHISGQASILLFGGIWYSGLLAGVGCLFSTTVASYSYRNIGARLSFIK